MSKVSLTARRVTLVSLTFLQVFFYPAFAFADAASDGAPSDPSSSTVTEAAPQSNSEATPVTEAPLPDSNEPTAPQTLEVIEPDAQLTPPEEVTPAVDDTTNSTTSQDQDTTINSSVHVTNNIPNTAQSGDAAVEDNRVGGNASTGNADGTVNLINLLQSQSNVLGQGTMLTFTADIQGNVVGDLMLDPGSLSVENNSLGSANVRVTNAAGITNLVDLDAQSGNATVAENRVGGDATTGNANAVANIVNLLNTIVNAGGSFFGNINIYGDLDGDILLPEGFLSSAIASNSIPTTTINVPTEYVLDTNLTNNQAINNQINVTADSGAASVRDNRVGGDATTGQATTNITVLNLIGNQIVGANTLLVFVNVQGEWVGLLMDAPGDSTAAALGGGIVQSTVQAETNVDVTNNQQIDNVVDVHAQSGDATVHDNRVGGNATAGNATASANIANMSNTQFALTNWFGILFINVFGTWHGSFGVNTAAGNPVAAAPPTNPETGNNNVPQQFATFVPGGVSTTVHHFQAPSNTSTTSTTPSSQQSTTAPAQTLSATTTDTASLNPLQPKNNDGSTSDSSSSWLFAGLGLLLAASLLASERLITIAQRRRT